MFRFFLGFTLGSCIVFYQYPLIANFLTSTSVFTQTNTIDSLNLSESYLNESPIDLLLQDTISLVSRLPSSEEPPIFVVDWIKKIESNEPSLRPLISSLSLSGLTVEKTLEILLRYQEVKG